ncbi:hypothetical protein [Wohlfahrtiimonas chitiniclastica]|uniref:hypothetical protein n=1 Tax=Wohlfahrtiimonas chitiniclastica TaxID=400946 RepID=UPI001BCEEF28|nr:hypothetical protein [Wohlfahrtiimonas chitiniclastica]MBS7836323.1 hypothetical protein [Wohlfahrtiimonas chitiniclastica]
MSKLRSYLIILWGALSAFLLLVIQSKNRKIEKQKEQIRQYKSKYEELMFINKKEQESKNDQDKINIASEHDIDSMLEQSKAYRD